MYQMGKAEMGHFGKGREVGFSVVPKAETLVMPRVSRAEGLLVIYVSKVIYQTWYLIRLINISGVLSN